MKYHQIVAGIIGLCVLSLGFSLRAEPIIEETFSGYLDNVLISASPAGLATGLAGDWTLVSESDFYVNRTQADTEAGTDKAVYDRPSDDNGKRTATRSTSAEHVLFENDGDVFYASFLIDPARAGGDMMFDLELEKIAGGGALDFSFGIFSGQYAVNNGGVTFDVSGGEVTAAEQLVLVRVEYGGGDSGLGNDEIITLWVDPLDESSEPVIDGVSNNLLSSGGGKIMSISIRGENMAGRPAFFDNLRVGYSFDAVIPEPSTSALLALGLVGLIAMIRRHR